MSTGTKTSEFLARLRTLGIRVGTQGGELRVSAPKGALTAELRTELGARKAEILSVLESASAAAVEAEAAEASAAPLPRVPRDGGLPLSFPQQRLWFLQQLEPELVAYNIPMSLNLTGELDIAALERSLNEIVRRHEVLRTSFPEQGGVPVQIVAEHVERPLERVDPPAGMLESDWWEEVKALLTVENESPFDLAQARPIRWRLFRINEERHVLHLAVHHIVFDGISIATFLQELTSLYESFHEGKPPQLEPPGAQYGDYAAWQRQLLEGDEFARQLEYWRETLGGDLPILELPTDRARPPIQTYGGSHEELTVPEELVAQLDALAKRLGVTLYMVLLAAYKALLLRMTGETDLIIGTAVNGRNHPDIERSIGFFVNTLALRTNVGGDPTFGELVRSVRDTCLGAYQHKDIPFERLVDELSPERNLAYSPIFQALFFHELDPAAPPTMSGLGIKPVAAEDGLDFRIARNDLTLWISYDHEEFIAWVEFNNALFDNDRMARFLRQYLTILHAVVDDVDVALSRLPLLPEEERRLVLETWNDTAAPIVEQPVHVRFEAQVERTPEAPALVFPSLDGSADQELSYAELDAAANRLARHLVARGAQPDDLVGLCLERSAEMVVAQLAIQKAGAAYVPLDPSYPRDRLAYMAEDAALRLVLTSSDLVSLLPDSVEPVRLDAEAQAIAEQDASRLGLDVSVRARMYVIYTSGSTGRPKGVELEHRSVSNFLSSMAAEPGLAASDSLLAVTTLSFDISVLETMLPLVVGAKLIVAPREATADGAQLIGLFERLAPTMMQATPATWRLLVLAGWKGDAKLRVLCGGEALPRELADDLVPLVGELWNVYGPTEATIWSTLDRVEAEGPITIGHPLANTQVYVLDANDSPQPIGVPGELWIAGDGLARGYLGRAELTDERFRPDPFCAGRAGARMYRTGDLARWRADGRLECLGRIDNQVKLRGFRIELGEIEAVLADAPGVNQVVCVVREDTPGDQRLTAYVVPRDGAELDAEALRDVARATLPVYMVPSGFVALEALPHTPNGKVDRNALLKRGPETGPLAASEVVEPRTDLERTIAGIWSDVLKLDASAISVTVNFFDLGGHSLLLAQVHAQLVEELGAKLSIIELFQYPTVAQIATHLEEEGVPAESRAEERAARGKNLAAGRRALSQRRRTRR